MKWLKKILILLFVFSYASVSYAESPSGQITVSHQDDRWHTLGEVSCVTTDSLQGLYDLMTTTVQARDRMSLTLEVKSIGGKFWYRISVPEAGGFKFFCEKKYQYV